MHFDVRSFVKSLRAIDLTDAVPQSEYETRITRLREAMEKRGLDASIAFGSELKPGDTGWLTGYDPQLESCAVVVGKEKVFILGGPEGEAYAEETKKLGKFRNLIEFKIPEEDYPGYEFCSFKEILEEACGRCPERVGILTLPEILPLSIYRMIKENIEGELVETTDIMLNLRYYKSEAEQRMMKKAALISTYAMKAMVAAVESGIRELEVAACGDYVMKAMGADRIGLVTLVCSGCRASNVIGRASNKEIEEGDLVVLGCSARYDGLTSCLGRTVVAGTASASQRELIGHAVESHELAEEKLIYNAPAKEVDIAARKYLSKYNLHPLYSITHGIGWTEAMEGKGVATQYSNWNFPKSISVMVDLGLFGESFQDISAEKLGLRIEDPYIINSKGETKRLTDLPRECEAGKEY